MSETDARYYQQHKDDSDEWGDAEQAADDAGNLVTVVSIRLSAAQERALRARAEAHGQPLSRFIREAALETMTTTQVFYGQASALDWVRGTSVDFHPSVIFPLSPDADRPELEPLTVNLRASA